MDVLFVRNLLRPQDLGGNRYPWEVTRRLAARGHRVRVVTPRPSGPLPGPTPVELVHYSVSRRTPFETFFTNAFFSRIAVRRAIARRQPAVVVLSSYDVAFGHFWLSRVRVPSVYIYHSSFYSDAVDRVARKPWPFRLAHPPLDAFTRYAEELTYRSADRIVAVSPFSRREIEARLRRPDDRIWLVPTGVDTAFFCPGDRDEARRNCGLALGARVLLTVGRLAPVKRYDRAIDVTRRLREHDPSWLLVIAGTGPADASLRSYAAPLGDAIRFAGFADGERLRDLYRAADIVLVTSEFENWSLAILEALATGTPVVGTPRGSIPDMLGLVDPRLIAPDVDVGSISATVRRIVDDDVSALRDACRPAIALRYDWERTVDRLDECLASAVEQSSIRCSTSRSGR